MLRSDSSASRRSFHERHGPSRSRNESRTASGSPSATNDALARAGAPNRADFSRCSENCNERAYPSVTAQAAATSAAATAGRGVVTQQVRSSTYRRGRQAGAEAARRACQGQVSTANAATAKGQPAGIPDETGTRGPTAL